jgi:hypothetical protein
MDLIAEFGWPHAFTVVGIATSLAACVITFFWALSRPLEGKRKEDK